MLNVATDCGLSAPVKKGSHIPVQHPWLVKQRREQKIKQWKWENPGGNKCRSIIYRQIFTATFFKWCTQVYLSIIICARAWGAFLCPEVDYADGCLVFYSDVLAFLIKRWVLWMRMKTSGTTARNVWQSVINGQAEDLVPLIRKRKRPQSYPPREFNTRHAKIILAIIWDYSIKL